MVNLQRRHFRWLAEFAVDAELNGIQTELLIKRCTHTNYNFDSVRFLSYMNKYGGNTYLGPY